MYPGDGVDGGGVGQNKIGIIFSWKCPDQLFTNISSFNVSMKCG